MITLDKVLKRMARMVAALGLSVCFALGNWGVRSAHAEAWQEEFKDKLSGRWKSEGTLHFEQGQLVAEGDLKLNVTLKAEGGEIRGWWKAGTSVNTDFLVKQGANSLKATLSPGGDDKMTLSCTIEGADPLGYAATNCRPASVTIFYRSPMNHWSPQEKDANKEIIAAMPKAQNIWNQWRVQWSASEISFWFNGRFVGSMTADGSAVELHLGLRSGGRLQGVERLLYDVDNDYVALDLTGHCNAKLAELADVGNKPASDSRGQVRFFGIPFHMISPLKGGPDHVDLSVTKWRRSKADLYNMAEAYAEMNAFHGDPAKVMLRVPRDYYTDLYVLAFSVPSEKTTPSFSLRMGNFQRGLLEMATAGVPMWDTRPHEAADSNVRPVANTGLWFVRVPINPANVQHALRSQEINPERSWIDIDLSKNVQLFRAYPDPYTACMVPLGLPSGVKILAATLKKSPVEMFVDSAEIAHVFMRDQSPAFNVHLKNRTLEEQAVRLATTVRNYYGESTGKEQVITLAAAEKRVITMDMKQPKLGHFNVKFDLYHVKARPRLNIPRAGEELLMSRSTSFAHLAHTLKKPHPQSCYGTWTMFAGGHYTHPTLEGNLLLMQKLGMRWSGLLYPDKEEELALANKHGVMGSQPKTIGYLFPSEPWKEGQLEAIIEKQKKMAWADSFTLLHEHYGLTPKKYRFRYPDPVIGEEIPPLTEEEKKATSQALKNLIAYATATKKTRPDTKIIFGHSNPMAMAPFFMMGFDRKYFDAYGLEPMMRMRMPERQPDFAGNRTYWAQEILKYFGMGDTPLRTHETGFYPTGPGWQTEEDQADMSVRFHLVHLAFPQFERFTDVGMLVNYAGWYGYGGWGPTGLFDVAPECKPKIACVAMATLIRMLDGPADGQPRPKIVKTLDMKSRALFGLKFKTHSNGDVHVFWTLAGTRPVTFSLTNAAATVKLTDPMGNISDQAVTDGKLTLTLSPAALYVQGMGDVTAVAPGTPAYVNRPGPYAEVLDPMASVSDWKFLSPDEMKATLAEQARLKAEGAVTEPTLGIDQTKSELIRRTGNFKIAPVADQEMGCTVWEVLPQKVEGHALVPMYQIIKREQPVVVTTPRARIGIWVKGNCGWGRVMFGFTDAKGNKWLSMEAKDTWNAEDTTSEAWIHFDGWRYIDLGMPGVHDGDGIQKPATMKWRYSGNMEVVYPIAIDTLVIQLQEEIVYLNKTLPVDPVSIRLKDLTISD